jgi:hypothetical protein
VIAWLPLLDLGESLVDVMADPEYESFRLYLIIFAIGVAFVYAPLHYIIRKMLSG